MMELPLPAALLVSSMSASLIIGLSLLGIPASFVVVSTVCIAGLGWSRDLRARTDGTALVGTDDVEGPAAPDGDPRPEREPDGGELDFDPVESTRVLTLQHVVPAAATAGSYAVFTLYPVY